MKKGNRPSRNKNQGENLPMAPEIFTLTGHRDNITAVKFHPVFTYVASASQDSTIKNL